MKFLTDFKLLTGAIMGIVAVVSVCFALNNYVAKDAELQLVAMRLDQKIIQDNIRSLQQQIWDLELYYKKIGKPIPPHIELQIRQMKSEIDRLRQLLKSKG
jgi:hypothetical protein